jgi:hypothetical protein
LRAQAVGATVASRQYTGVGVYVDISVPEEMKRVVPPEMIFGDVNLELRNAEPGVCVLLYVDCGFLSLLEFVTSAGPWPDEPIVERITYFEEVPTGDGFSLVPCAERHSAALARALRGRGHANAA